MKEANRSQQGAPGLVENASIPRYQQGRAPAGGRDTLATISTEGTRFNCSRRLLLRGV